jgi:hypothetical protein
MASVSKPNSSFMSLLKVFHKDSQNSVMFYLVSKMGQIRLLLILPHLKLLYSVSLRLALMF